MPEPLPKFRYYRDPVQTDVVIASDTPCLCCGKARGYIYVGPTYTTHREVHDNLCPWCIADGSAAEKFSVEFTEVRLLYRAGISRDIMDEVCKRTPGYFCWQSQCWQPHCGDACVYHGDATVEDVAHASRSTIDAWKAENNMTDADWQNLTDGYEPKGHSAFYKFVCRHCSEVRLSWDLD